MKTEYLISFISIPSDIIVNAPDFKIIIGLFILIILLFASALMSGAELAFFSFRPEDIEKFKTSKDKQAKTALKLYNDPEKLLSTILAANNTVNIAIVLLAVFLSSRMFDFSSRPVMGFIVNTLVISFILLLFGEVMPKVYSSRNYIAVALFMANPLAALQKIFYPITSMLISSSAFIKKRAGVHRADISMNDLSDALELTSDSLNEDEKILKGIVNFGNINVSSIMCPRIDVTTVDIKSGFIKIIQTIINSGFSRIPVYSGSFDNVKGILYAKDVLPYANNPDNFKWQALLRPSYFIPETKKINDLLKEFQTKKMHMAVVIDEYGGTSGIVTLEDVLEEIVGEINDDNNQTYRKVDDKTYIFEGKILLNDFCRIVGIDETKLEDVKGESETLAGLILELTGEIPQKDQVIKYGNFIFRIESDDRRRIKEIKVEINKDYRDIEKD